MELTGLTIQEASGLLEAKTLSPLELVRASLERIHELNPKLNAYITVMADSALEAASTAEAEIQRGDYRGPLHGVPVSLKDLYYTNGTRTTAGSKILAHFVPEYDATVSARLRDAGAVIVGKTNMHEFASGAADNPHYGAVKNPWNLDHITGGTSAGSGAAVAAWTDLASMGSDTGGSVRVPAALCGVVGLKPTYGLVSRYGIVPGSWSLDHTGPLTRTAADAAIVLRAVAGYDANDPSSAHVPIPDYLEALDGDVRGLRVGVPKEYFWEGLDAEVETLVSGAIATLGELGCVTQEVSLPAVRHSPDASVLIAAGEVASVHHEWLRTRPEDYGEDVLIQYQQASMEPAVHYIKAQQVRRRITEELQGAFEKVDLLVTPSVGFPAPRAEEERNRSKNKVSRETPYGRLFRPFNLSGHPAVSVPCGFTKAGLPTAFQLVGGYFREAAILNAAHAYQGVTDWHLRVPAIPEDGL